ncbi:MAG: RluA family pseudouridine synthase [Bacteroidales bacterium]
MKIPHILYEDNHLLIVNKQVGDLVQADKERNASLEEQIKQFIKERDKKPFEVYLGIPHRLDRPVSGLVLFTKTSKALIRINRMFQQGEVHKTYHALVKHCPAQSSRLLTHYIVRNEKQNKSYARPHATPNSKEARLRYRLISQSEQYFLLEIELLTGRHHQIRAQLAAIGSPIKGDLKYGFARSNPNGGISLHAHKLSLMHPIRHELIELTAPYPKGDIWETCKTS